MPTPRPVPGRGIRRAVRRGGGGAAVGGAGSTGPGGVPGPVDVVVVATDYFDAPGLGAAEVATPSFCSIEAITLLVGSKRSLFTFDQPPRSPMVNS